MWRRYFKLKLVPGVVITKKFGRIDFRMDDLRIENLLELYEDDFPYLELTNEGRARFYGVGKTEMPTPVEIVPEIKSISRKRSKF